MYEEIFNQIRSAANKRNLKDSTIHAYYTNVAHFLNSHACGCKQINNCKISYIIYIFDEYALIFCH